METVIYPASVSVAVAILCAFLAYWFGLKAYFRQREHEDVRDRYLDRGLDLYISSLGYAMGVNRNNWALVFRTLKRYRDNEAAMDISDFFDNFIELDQSRFDFSVQRRVTYLVADDVLWTAYLSAFAYVGTRNDKMKADFGDSLRTMLQTPNHPNKTQFVDEAEKMAREISEESGRFYNLLGETQGLAEILSTQKLQVDEISTFAQENEVQEIVTRLKEQFPNAEDDAA